MVEPVLAVYEQELRLLLALALNGCVLFASFRYATRMSGRDWLDRCIDTLLLYYIIQYLVVGICGLIGLLSTFAIATVALILCAPAWFAHDEQRAATGDTISLGNRLTAWGIGFFFLGFLLAVVVSQHVLAPLTTDGLTYHLPAAAQWLQTGRLGLFETWLFNPANTYSPLGGSVFMAWLIAPLGHEGLARCAQAPALILIFLCAMQIVRRLGTDLSVAALVAAALALSQPFIIQATLVKDDLYLAAFLLASMAAMLPHRLKDRHGALRLGIAVGLVLSIKYTALLALPIILPGVDGTWRAGWRRREYVIALTAAAALAGPWYLRNIILAGNPVFPLQAPGLPGILSTERSLQLRAPDTIWRVVTENYYGMPAILTISLTVIWAAASLLNIRRMNEPIVRICIFGPLLGFALFILKAPYGEVRFLLPTFGVMFVSAGLLLSRIRRVEISAALALGLAALSIMTAFREGRHFIFLEVGIAAAVVSLALVVMDHLNWISRRRLIGGSALLLSLVLLLLIYVDWNGYVSDMRANAINAWKNEYPQAAPAWQVVRDSLPPGCVIAYAGTHLTYPLMGFDLQHRVVYAPVRPGVQTIADLPRIARPLPGEQIDRAVATITIAGADRRVWLSNLSQRGATHLVILKNEKIPAPELEFAGSMPQRFREIFVSDEAMVYEIIQD